MEQIINDAISFLLAAVFYCVMLLSGLSVGVTVLVLLRNALVAMGRG